MPQSRLAIIEQIYHSDGSQPTPCDFRQTKILTSTEQPFIRRFQVAGEWMAPPLWWSDDIPPIAVIHLWYNAIRHDVNPTPAEMAEEMARGVLVAPDAILFPGDAQRWRPVNPKSIRLMCVNGTADLTIRVYPA